VPVGLPQEITPAALMLNEQPAEGKIVLTSTPATIPGLYNLFVSGQTKLAYKRNEQAVAAATAVKTAADAALLEVTAANQKAAEAKTAADTLAATNAAALTAATNALTVAQTAVTTADAALKTATDAATAAKTAAANATGDQALAAAATAAEKVAADAAVAQKTAADALVVAQKTMTDADAASKAAELAKVAATEAAAAATAVLTQATAEKAVIDKAVVDLTAAAQPKDIDVFVQSPPLSLKVAAAPVNLKLAAATAGPVKQGEMVELPVSIERLYGFADATEVVLTVPQNFKGLSGTVALAAGVADGKLTIVAAKDAPVGKHALQITAKMSFNGQAVETSLPIEVTVEAAPAAEKK
jgi:hypothetical protein